MGTAGTIVTIIITGILSGGLWQGLAEWRRSRREERESQHKAALEGRQDDRTADRDGVELVTIWREEAKASAKQAADAQRETVSLRRDVDALLNTTAHQGEVIEGLVEYLRIVAAGIEDGTVPPLPAMPLNVRNALEP